MNVEYSRQFIKAASRLTGKYKDSLKGIVAEIKEASDLSEVTECIKLVSLRHTYRIKMGDYRLIILFKIQGNTVIFELLSSRGETYKNQNEELIRKKDKLS
jgi:mRNA-degrading endonuclease RelE of RelBE toxin-antitoxin system